MASVRFEYEALMMLSAYALRPSLEYEQYRMLWKTNQGDQCYTFNASSSSFAGF